MRIAAYSFIVVSILLFAACGSQQTQRPSAIGILPLQGYEAIHAASADTTYQLYRTNQSFADAFRQTSSNARKPDLGGQMVVSVQLKNRTSMQYERAEFIGNRINVFLKTCTASANPDCVTGYHFLATIPRVGNGRSVQFHINGEGKSIVSF
jgi:hypothetical protein